MKYITSVFIVSMLSYAAAQFSDSLCFALVSKCIASASFLTAGILSFRNNENPSQGFVKFSRTIILGLFFSFIADVLLEIIFEAGFGFFFIAQVTYLVAVLRMRKPSKVSWFIFAVLETILFITEFFNPALDFEGLFIPLFVYISVVVLNVILTLYLLKSERKSAKLFPIGMMLFFLSDYILQFKLFGSLPEVPALSIRVLNVLTYFPGQYFIALSLKEDFLVEN